ncbi:MAG: hypothetical protein ABIR96_07560 [Bdellovibrionota bacterium]
MIFITAIFFAIFLGSVFFALELRSRRLRGLKPGNMRDMWIYSQKKAAPHLRYPALLFALMTLFFFQIWEAFLRFMLQRDSYVILFLVGFSMVMTAIVLRQKRLASKTETDLRLGSLTLVLTCLGLSVLLNSWGTILFIPWVYFRASFLPKRLG